MELNEWLHSVSKSEIFTGACGFFPTTEAKKDKNQGDINKNVPSTTLAGGGSIVGSAPLEGE